MIVVNLILLVNRLILKKSGDSDETDDSGDTVESSASDKCDKSCYPIGYGYQCDSHQTYNSEDSDVFCGSAGPGESGDYSKFVDFGEVTDDIIDFGEFADSEELTDDWKKLLILLILVKMMILKILKILKILGTLVSLIILVILQNLVILVDVVNLMILVNVFILVIFYSNDSCKSHDSSESEFFYSDNSNIKFSQLSVECCDCGEYGDSSQFLGSFEFF